MDLEKRTSKAPDRSVVAVTTALPLAALAAYFVLAPGVSPAHAAGSCLYEGKSYSEGACVQSVCTTGEGQKCENGSWSSCQTC